MIRVRYVQALLLFSNSVVLYINRLHVAITIIAMTKKDKSNSEFMIFDWDEGEKSFILSSFYLGYIVAQIPASFLVRRYKVKLTLFSSTFASGLISLIVPICVTSGGWQTFCILRALMGLLQGGHYPAFQQHLTNWSPLAERTVMFGFCFSGYSCGQALGILLAGIIATSTLGWPGTFYIFASLCFVWCCLWLLFGANDFNTSKCITAAERTFIESSLQQSVNFGTEKLKIPWGKIFSSMPFWSVMIARSTSSFSFHTLFYYEPSYMNSIFKFEIRDNGLYSMLPYLAQWFALYFYMFIGEFLLRRKCFSLTIMRKLFNSVGLWSTAALTLCYAFVDAEQKALAIFLFTLLMTTLDASVLGCSANFMDLAPNYSAIMTGIVNTIGNIANFLGPICAGLIVRNEENRDQWTVLFFLVAVMFILGDLAFLVWGTTEEQTWNAAPLPKTASIDEMQGNHTNVDSTNKEQINLSFINDLEKKRNLKTNN